jgi:hypothetical protein
MLIVYPFFSFKTRLFKILPPENDLICKPLKAAEYGDDTNAFPFKRLQRLWSELAIGNAYITVPFLPQMLRESKLECFVPRVHFFSIVHQFP